MSKLIHILMVEDSPTDAELAKEALQEGKLRNKLSVAEDGVQAMDFLLNCVKNGDCPDLILLDLNMPKKDGRQVLTEIKEHALLKHIPVVVLTTSSDESDILKSYQLQASAYVTKPVDFNKFASMVQELQQFYFELVTLPPNCAKIEKK